MKSTTTAGDAARRESVELLAEDILRRHGVVTTPVDVDRLAELEGVRFMDQDLKSLCGAYLGVLRPAPSVSGARQPPPPSAPKEG